MRVVEITKTCGACPAQWEGRTDDDRAVYVRYRYGSLTIDVSEPGGTMNAAIDSETPVVDLVLGDRYDGYMTEAELLAVTPTIIWPGGFGR